MNSMQLGQWEILGRAGAALVGTTVNYLSRSEAAKQREEAAKRALVIAPPPLPPPPPPEIVIPPPPPRVVEPERPWYQNPLAIGGLAAGGIGLLLLLKS